MPIENCLVLLMSFPGAGKKTVGEALAKKTHFFPVRLLCDEGELIKRVRSEDRKNYFKTRDAELSGSRSREKEVFYSRYPNEITIDNTHKFPDEVADMIIGHIQKIY